LETPLAVKEGVQEAALPISEKHTEGVSELVFHLGNVGKLELSELAVRGSWNVTVFISEAAWLLRKKERKKNSSLSFSG